MRWFLCVCTCICVYEMGIRRSVCTCVWIIISWLDACSLTVQPMMSWLTRILIIHQNKVPFHTHWNATVADRRWHPVAPWFSADTEMFIVPTILCLNISNHCKQKHNVLYACTNHTQLNAHARTRQRAREPSWRILWCNIWCNSILDGLLYGKNFCISKRTIRSHDFHLGSVRWRWTGANLFVTQNQMKWALLNARLHIKTLQRLKSWSGKDVRRQSFECNGTATANAWTVFW